MTTTAAAAPGIAVFDVDETLARDDLIKTFVVLLVRRRPLRLLRLLPAVPLVAARLLRGHHGAAKEALLRPLISGLRVAELERLGEQIAAAAQLNDDVADALERHRARGESVWLASAQVEAIVRPLSRRVGAHGYVATRLAVAGDALTGRLAGPNTRSEAKVAALDAALPEGWRLRCTAYSDGDADAGLLAAVRLGVKVDRGRCVVPEEAS